MKFFPDARLRVGGECLLDLVHLDALGVVARLVEEAVDEDLQEVPREVVGLLRVGAGHLRQGALLARAEERVGLADAVVVARPDDHEVGGWHLCGRKNV